MTAEEEPSLDELLGPDPGPPPTWREDSDFWYVNARTDAQYHKCFISHRADMRRRYRQQQREEQEAAKAAELKRKEITVASKSPTAQIQEAIESYFQWMAYLALLPGGVVCLLLNYLGVMNQTLGLIVMGLFILTFTVLYLNRAFENNQVKKQKRRQARHRNRNNIN